MTGSGVLPGGFNLQVKLIELAVISRLNAILKDLVPSDLAKFNSFFLLFFTLIKTKFKCVPLPLHLQVDCEQQEAILIEL